MICIACVYYQSLAVMFSCITARRAQHPACVQNIQSVLYECSPVPIQHYGFAIFSIRSVRIRFIVLQFQWFHFQHGVL